MRTPFPPYQKRILPDKFGNGMDSGQMTRTGNTVWHRMLGTLDGTDSYFRLAWVAAATNWGIGGSLDGAKDGVIYLWVDNPGNRIPWASGTWNAPGYEDGAEYVHQFGQQGINSKADSIEFSGQLATPMTLLQWQKGIWLTAAIIHAGGRDSEDTLWNMQHREFTTPAVKDCPFPEVYKYTKQYQRGIVLTLQHYEGKNVDDAVSINGIIVPLPFSQQPEPEPEQPTKPLFVSFKQPLSAILWKGASYRQYGNTQAPIYRKTTAVIGEMFVGYYHGQMVAGSDRWFVVDNHTHDRIHESGIKQWIDELPSEG
jgi:hypothetical protein